MSLCKYSSKYTQNKSTSIENSVILKEVPSMPDHCLKVYLYGLMLCECPDGEDNSIERMSRVLNISIEDIKVCFDYLSGQRLITITNNDPLTVVFTHYDNSATSKLPKGKYDMFNRTVQELLSGRLISPSEFNMYYEFIEQAGFDPDAIICIINQCVQTKGNDIGSAYIMAILRDFSHKNIKSFAKVDEHFKEQLKYKDEILAILKALGLRRLTVYPEEQELYTKWTDSFGFTQGVILELAKKCKNKGGIEKLDTKISKYYEQKLTTIQEIEAYDAKLDSLFAIAKEATNSLGLYYQNLEVVVNTYITDWTNLGFDGTVIKEIANYCFKRNIRSLDGMNTIIQKFYKLGLLTLPAISQYIGELVSADQKIQDILDKLNILRNVNSWDRDMYRTWTYNWNLSDEIILYVAELAKGKAQPMQYLSKLLATLHEQNITTLDKAKTAISTQKLLNNDAKTYETRNYNKKELDSLFDNLDDIEV